MSISQISIISGKGGTGKTTLAASIIPFLSNLVIADADVDAPDLKILLDSEIIHSEDFVGLQRAKINYDKCIHCGLCHEVCNFGAISSDIIVNSGKCEGCTVCKVACPVDAISMLDYVVGSVFERTTSYGPMIDARLTPGEESSGKLVAEVRKLARDTAYKENRNTIIIDGSPGIACNVISTISGVSKALIVTEPTESGIHDLKRVLSLSKMFSVKAKVVINKFDLNNKKSQEIIDFCDLNGTEVVLKIPFDKRIVESISNLVIPSVDNIPFFESKEWLSFVEYLIKSETH